ncbi:hypothetical protein, partial [Shewanella sp.]|uniref:hypothetical protein n=1 Tax=Shewanella sp. TaxID=50422 RepID=UPI0040477865
MAAPEIAGMVALAQQLALQELRRLLSFEEIRSLFKSTGDPIVDGDDENDLVPNTGLTFYRADMLAMADAILAMKPAVSHTVTIVSGGVLEEKNFGFSNAAAVQGLSTDDFIVGSELGEVIRGGAGDDQIDGGSGDDVISGEAGNDQITPGVGNDTVDGGDGDDTVIYLGNRSAYTITFDSASATYTVSSLAEGTDKVTKAETFKFANSTVSAQYVISSVGSQYNDRVMADTESAIIDTGEGIDTVVYKSPASKITKASGGWFVNGNLLKNVERVEFTDKIVALDIDGISGKAYRIYQAAFARTPDNGGLKYWINTMDTGHSLEAV